MKNYFNKGFTLAEVLITLAIIGVVAAVTVPNLMTSTRGKEYEVGANKALSTLSNAAQMRYAMSGETFETYNAKMQAAGLNANVVPLAYLACPVGSAVNGVSQQDAAATAANAGSNTTYTITPSIGCTGGRGQPALPTVSNNGGLNTTLIFKDGMHAHFIAHTSNANAANPDWSIWVAVDTNGNKGPTRMRSKNATKGVDAVCSSFVADDIDVTAVADQNAAPTTNSCPDVVVFRFDADRDLFVPANQRTRNILATGNAMISQ